MKNHIKDFMTALPQTIGESASLQKALSLMNEINCHHLPVLNGGQLVGMISKSDISLVLLTTKGSQTLVKDIMSTSPFVVDADTSLKEVATHMVEQGICSAIVSAKNSSPWGIFTSTDALKVIAQKL